MGLLKLLKFLQNRNARIEGFFISQLQLCVYMCIVSVPLSAVLRGNTWLYSLRLLWKFLGKHVVLRIEPY